MYWAGADLEYRRRARTRDGSEEVPQQNEDLSEVGMRSRRGPIGSDGLPSSGGFMGFGDCAFEQSHTRTWSI